MSHTHLSARERCVILTLSQFGLNQAEIARRLYSATGDRSKRLHALGPPLAWPPVRRLASGRQALPRDLALPARC